MMIRMVICNEVEIRNIVPLVFLLECTLHGILDWILEAQQKEEEKDLQRRTY